MVPSFYQTVDTGIISLIKPAPDFHNHPFSSYFFCLFRNSTLYLCFTPIPIAIGTPGGTLKFVSFLKSRKAGFGGINKERKIDLLRFGERSLMRKSMRSTGHSLKIRLSLHASVNGITE